MGFNIFKWLTRKTEDEQTQTGTRVPVKDFMDNDSSADLPGVEYYLQRMAFWTIVRKIGSAVASVEWETYRRGSSVKAKEYWSWNFEPNPNQSAEEFFRKLIGELFLNGEALVVEIGPGYRYVADSFNVVQKLNGDEYQNVIAYGQNINRNFSAKEVLHFTYDGVRLKQVMASVAGAQGRLIKSASSAYIRNQGTRGVLRIDELAEADSDFDETYDDLVNDKFKKYFTAENAVLPLFKGYEFDTQESTGGSTKSSLSGTRDIRSMYDDIIDLTAQAMGVPASIVNSKKVEKDDFSHFLTATIMPLVKMIAEEINRKMFGSGLVYAGTYVSPNYSNIKYTDLFDIADPIDKLIGSGTFSINDIRQRLGFDTIEEDWAKQHWMTKNYSPAPELLAGLENPEGKEDTENE